MGWKLSMMWVNPAPKTENSKLLEALGFDHYFPADRISFDEALNPHDHRLCIGRYGDNLIVCLPFEVTHEFFSPQPSKAEVKVVSLFPSSEIYISSLMSVVNHWGYCLIKNGKKLRYRMGDSEVEAIEFGEPLPEEGNLLAQSAINASGKRVYNLKEFPEETFTEDQVGENFVFGLFTRYLEDPLDVGNNDLYELEMEVFTKKHGQLSVRSLKENLGGWVKTRKASWWKFW